MRRKILVPLLAILVAAFGGLAATLLADNSPELGLDLQGGVSVVLAPTGDASGEQLDQALSIIRDRVDALGVAEPDITRQGDAIVVQLPGATNRDRALQLVGQTAELQFRPVLQQSEVSPDALAEAQAQADEAAGEAGTTTTTTGDSGAPADTTTTTAPATTDTSEGAVGLVEGESAGPAQQPTTTTTAPPATTTTAPAEQPAEEAPPEQVPQLTPRDQETADAEVTLAGEDGASVYTLGPSLATGRIVSTARADIQNGQWLVALEMHGGEDGIDKFNEIAAQCFGGQNPEVCPPTGVTEDGVPTGRVAIVLDNVVQSAPSINGSNFARDQISISGDFSESEAKDLALVLRYGSLPVELERQTVQTVSATLGEDSLRAGIVAGVVGLSLVALYLILYYRALGIVVVFGFAVWGALMYTVVSWLGATQGLALTLAGVTGMIMSIGVTADSYVVFFERLKDDVRAGRTLRSSTERSFKRAFRTILAANMTSFIGAAVLWWLTVGSVRGFALFLGLSTVLGVIVTWFYTRPVVIWLSSHRVFTDMPVLGVARGLSGRRGVTEPAAVAGGTGR
jgi:preprotein translocase subunit SecD